MARIRTTHTGSLPRPHELEAMIVARDEGDATPGFEARVAAAVDEVVQRQTDTGSTCSTTASRASRLLDLRAGPPHRVRGGVARARRAARA